MKEISQYGPPVVVRSLSCVGGDRPGKTYRRRMNRKARSMGFATYAQFMAHLMSNPVMVRNINKIASAVTARRAVAL
ncbi:hypothetical protein ACQUFY_05810 [Robbsia andropogonis]|uniref:hypothetical protein n=1 Tax=Robbsia andropogonis TaxID=28092 RepID=UPI003D1B34BB